MSKLHAVVQVPRSARPGRTPQAVGSVVDCPIPEALLNIGTRVVCRGRMAVVMEYEFYSTRQCTFPIRFDDNGVWAIVALPDVVIVDPVGREKSLPALCLWTTPRDLGSRCSLQWPMC